MRTWATILLVLFSTLLLVSPPAAMAQAERVAAMPDSTALLHIERAFRAADPEALLDGAADRIDIVVFGKGESYSRTQATLVLGDFFRRHPPRQVIFEQEVLAEDRRSLVGRYWTTGGGEEPVGVTVRLRMREARWQLRGIRVDRKGR